MRLLSIDWPVRAALLITIPVTLIVAALTFGGHALDSIEHSFFDWRTALLGDRLASSHPGIAVVRIAEPTAESRACRSPVDRELLAHLIRTIDAAGARVIAIDYLFDQPTTPAADDALKAALADAKAPIVLAAYDNRARSTPLQRQRQRDLLTAFGKPVGYVSIVTEFDGRVRTPAEPDKDTLYPLSFPQQIAKAAGVADPKLPRRIAWLRTPPSGDTFLTFEASALLGAGAPGQAAADPTLGLLKDRVVLIGGDLLGQDDSYLTPLSTTAEDKDRMMPGVVVNAHMAAQLLGGRDYYPLPDTVGLGLAIIAAFIGALYGWYFQDWRGPVNIPPIALFFAADLIAFGAFRAIIPFAIPATAWVLAAWIGKWVIKKEAANG